MIRYLDRHCVAHPWTTALIPLHSDNSDACALRPKLGRNAQPPGPHPFYMPDHNELLTLVSTHISDMSTMSSSIFDTITPAFIKCAYKRAPRQHERGWENISMLAPHIAAHFKLLITKANAPRSWKEAKLTPIHIKEGRTITEN